MKSILVNLKSESDLYEKYSDNISNELINYLIKESKYTKNDVKIVINTKLNIKNLDSLIKNALIKTYEETRKVDRIHNVKQILFFILGIVFLIFSTFVLFDLVKEIVIIAGWVAIWEVVDISLNVDSELKINRKLIKKLIECRIEVNNI